MVTPAHVHFTENFGFLEVVADLLRCLNMETGAFHTNVAGGVIYVHSDLPIAFIGYYNVHNTLMTFSRIYI